MKLGPVTKADKGNKTTSKKKLNMTSWLQTVTPLLSLIVLAKSGAIRKPDSGRITSKTYIVINANR